MGSDVRKLQAMLAGALGCLLLVLVGVASAAPTSKGGCRPKHACTTTSSTTTSTTTSTTSSTTTSTTTTLVDTAAPTVAITGPAAGATVDGVLTVSGTGADDRSVSRVEVQLDGGSWNAASGTTSWSTSLDTASWGPGTTHRITARAFDAAGNASAVQEVTVQKASPAPTGGGDASVAPATQGTWTSPEGVRFEVSSAGPWTIRDVYRMLLESSAAPGDFAKIAPTLTVKVQDTTATQTSSMGRATNGVYDRFYATIYLKGVASSFATFPDALLAHEYGHAWAAYHLYLTQQDDWSRYLQARWVAPDGSSRLADDARLGSSYSWSVDEIIADDYRLLFGSSSARSQKPAHMNSDIVHPNQQPDLRDFLAGTWAGQ